MRFHIPAVKFAGSGRSRSIGRSPPRAARTGYLPTYQPASQPVSQRTNQPTYLLGRNCSCHAARRNAFPIGEIFLHLDSLRTAKKLRSLVLANLEFNLAAKLPSDVSLILYERCLKRQIRSSVRRKCICPVSCNFYGNCNEKCRWKRDTGGKEGISISRPTKFPSRFAKETLDRPASLFSKTRVLRNIFFGGKKEPALLRVSLICAKFFRCY